MVLGKYVLGTSEIKKYSVDYSEWLNDGELLIGVTFDVGLATVPPLVITDSVIDDTDAVVTFYAQGGDGKSIIPVGVNVTTSLAQIKTDTINFASKASLGPGVPAGTLIVPNVVVGIVGTPQAGDITGWAGPNTLTTSDVLSRPNIWASPQTFNGGAIVPTQSHGDNTTKAASTAFVQAALSGATFDTSQPYTWASRQTFSGGIASVSFTDLGGTLRWDYGVSHANGWTAPSGSLLFYGNVDSSCVFNFFDSGTSGRVSKFSVQTTDTANNMSLYNAAAPAITGSIRGYTASLSCTGEIANYIQQNGVGSAVWDILLVGTPAAQAGAFNRYVTSHPSSQAWVAGLDPNDGLSYKIAPGSNWGTAAALKITPAGVVSIPGGLTVPTRTAGDNTTNAASTAFVTSAAGSVLEIASAAAVATTTIPTALTTIRTVGYSTAGDGGGGLYALASVQSADQGRIQSADGRWWQYVPDNRGVNARAFGAKADGVDATPFQGFAGAYYGTVNITGTDNTQFIQNAIDFALRNKIRTVYLSSGVYVVASTLHLGWGNSFYSINLEGDVSAYTRGLAGTTIIFTATNGSQCINVAGARTSTIKGICFFYPTNFYWIYNNVWVVRGGTLTTTAGTLTSSNVLTFAGGVPSTNIAVGQTIADNTTSSAIAPGTTVLSFTSTTVTMSANAAGPGVASGNVISFTDPAFVPWILPSVASSWVNPALTTALATNCPIAAITVDAFAGTQPTPHYPTVTFPSWTGLSGQYNKNAFSSNVQVLNCTFQGWPVAYALGINTAAQGDFTVIRDIIITQGALGFSINNTQSRNVDIKNIDFQFLHTLLDNCNFGGKAGEWAGPISNLSGGESYQVFDFNGNAGMLEISNVYSEGGLRRFGRWLGYQQLKLRQWLVTFDDSPYGMERALVETYVYSPEVTFEGCQFGNQYGIQQLTYGNIVRTVLGTSNYFASNCTTQFPDTSAPGYQAVNFGGGIILNGGASYPASQNKVRGASQANYLSAAGTSTAVWSDTDAPTAGVNYLFAWREGTESFRDHLSRKWDIIQVAPQFTPPTNSGTISKVSEITGLSQTGAVVTFTRSTTQVTNNGFNHWGLQVGDIIVDQNTGTLYVCTAVASNVYTLVQQNNFDNYPTTGFVDRSVTGWTPTSAGTPASIVTSGGLLRIIRTQQLFSQEVYFGDFVAGSPNVTNIHAGDLDGSTIATFLTPGTLLFCPGLRNLTTTVQEAITGEFPVTKSTYIGTSTNGGSGTTPGSLTLTAADLTTPVNAIRTGRFPIAPIGIRSSVPAPLIAAPTTVTAATYTVSGADTTIIANRAGTITVTLPSATILRKLRVKTVQNQTMVSNASNVVSLDGSTTSTAILSATAGKWAELESDGTNWVIMAAN